MFTSLASSSSGNLYTVNDGQTRILLECGLPHRELSRLLHHDVTRFAGCFITHQHQDHATAAPTLARRGMAIYCHPDTAMALGIEAEATAMLPGTVQRINTLLITAIEGKHDVPCNGYLIYSIATKENLLFALDTCYLQNRFNRLTEIAVECNHSRETLLADNIPAKLKERIMRTHMSLETFSGMLAANDLSQVRKIYLLHMSNQRGNAERFKAEIMKQTGVITEVC
jgi:phosphoribosyl 1,2-cyclic phosphodiesterase